MLTVTQLRNVGMLDNHGLIIDYPGLSEKQRVVVVRNVLSVLNANTDGQSTDQCIDIINCNINNYLTATSTAGRSIYPGFPDFIVRTLISEYGSKLIDYMILQDE